MTTENQTQQPFAIGKPNYAGGGDQSGRQSLTFHKLGHKEPKNRVLVVRIAPPVGPLAERGIWALYVKQHFGYSIPFTNRNGEVKKIPVTFRCLERQDRNGNITQRCPECDEINRQKEKLAAKEKELSAKGLSEDDIKAQTAFVRMWLKEHNLDRKWNMVAKDNGSRWGFLTISHACFKLLKGNEQAPGLIDTLIANGIDPLSPDKGLWIRFTRNGTAFNEIRDIPTVETESVTRDGETYERKKYDALTQADIDAISKLPALDTLGRELTFDAIKRIVDSGGDEEILRDVMNMPRQAPRSAQGAAPTAAATASAPQHEEEPTEMSASLSKAPAKGPEVSEIERLKAQLALLQAAAAPSVATSPAAATTVTVKATAPSPSPALAKEVSAMDMDAFLAKYQ